MRDAFKAMKEESQERRAKNRDQSPRHLEQEYIPYVSKNDGAHLIVGNEDNLVDFWPGTGKWIARKGGKGRGVHNLIKFIKESNNAYTK